MRQRKGRHLVTAQRSGQGTAHYAWVPRVLLSLCGNPAAFSEGNLGDQEWLWSPGSEEDHMPRANHGGVPRHLLAQLAWSLIMASWLYAYSALLLGPPEVAGPTRPGKMRHRPSPRSLCSPTSHPLPGALYLMSESHSGSCRWELCCDAPADSFTINTLKSSRDSGS